MPMYASDTGSTAAGLSSGGFMLVMLAVCVAVIAALVIVILWQRKWLRRKDAAIVRHVALYLHARFKDYPWFHPRRPEPELTQMEIIEIMHILKKMLYACALLLPALPLSAQDVGVAAIEKTVPSWYVGVQGGVPFGVSTFSSFGADKTRAGYAVGVYGGRRFNPVLSLEAQASWGKVYQSAQSCCTDYWLGADGLRYEVPVAGMAGWSYADLKSSTFVQRYGVQLNVNVLGFFNRTRHGRWSLELSPHVAAIGTQSDIQASSSGSNVMECNTRWHFGVGGNLQAGCQVAKHINIGVYSGITYLTGDPMDGMPEYRHKANYIWESGIRLGLTFGKKQTNRQVTSKQGDLPESTTITPSSPNSSPSSPITPTEKETNAASQVTIQSSPSGELRGASSSKLSDAVGAVASLSFPTIHFPFNGTSIPESELPKARRILDLLREHPEVRVTVTGWCDTRGSRAVNDRISLRRAEAVKAWLVAQGIAGERITAVGKGSDVKAADAKEARRADTEERKQ